jgi:hypothetical protein
MIDIIPSIHTSEVPTKSLDVNHSCVQVWIWRTAVNLQRTGMFVSPTTFSPTCPIEPLASPTDYWAFQLAYLNCGYVRTGVAKVCKWQTRSSRTLSIASPAKRHAMLTSAVEFKGHRQCFLQPALPGRVSRPQRLTICANSKPVPPAQTPQSKTSSLPVERSDSKHASSVPSLQVPRKRLSRAQIIAERFSDTAYDVYLHYARLAKLRRDTRKSLTAGQKVVVLGSGWGAHSLIKVIDLDQFESVTMLSPRNYFVSILLSRALYPTVYPRVCHGLPT